MLEPEFAEKLADSIGPAAPLALLECEGTVYFARHTPTHPNEPLTAIVKLIQGVYETNPAMARKIIRNRIFATGDATPMCQGMVRVAARRLSTGLVPRNHAIQTTTFSLVEMHALAPRTVSIDLQLNATDADCMREATRLALSVNREGPRYERDRAIAAVLVDAEGAVLSAGINTNAKNRTLHAEVNLLQDLFARTKRGIPPGARLYTTMQPCKMCAGMIARMAEDLASLSIIYAERDPGPNARATAVSHIERPL